MAEKQPDRFLPFEKQPDRSLPIEEQLDRFLTIDEVRKIAGNVSRSTIWRWCKAGLFPKPKKIGPHRTGWLRSDIEEWIKTRESS